MRRALPVAVVLALAACGGGEKEAPNVVAQAMRAYADAKLRGVDMSRGPCLGAIAEDWVADVAHNPRQPVDDDPRNQCAAFRQGRAHHFVELDPQGRLIRAT